MRKESFVNICVTQVDDNNKDTGSVDMSVTESLEPVAFTGPSSPKRSSKIRSGTSGLFHRRKTSKAAEDGKAVGASHTITTDAKNDIDGLSKVSKPRSKSEGAATLKEVHAHVSVHIIEEYIILKFLPPSSCIETQLHVQCTCEIKYQCI